MQKLSFGQEILCTDREKIRDSRKALRFFRNTGIFVESGLPGTGNLPVHFLRLKIDIKEIRGRANRKDYKEKGGALRGVSVKIKQGVAATLRGKKRSRDKPLLKKN